MLTEARRRIDAEPKLKSLKTTKLDLVRLDVGNIPMQDGKVDCLHAGAAMHCWPDLDKAASEIYRVLKPGGRAVLMTFNSLSWLSLMQRLARLKLDFDDAPVHHKLRPSHLKDWTRIFSKSQCYTERFPKATRHNFGWKSRLFNQLVIPIFGLIPRSLIKNWGHHCIALVEK